jgi:hypothetical protein
MALTALDLGLRGVAVGLVLKVCVLPVLTFAEYTIVPQLTCRPAVEK